MHYYQKPFTSRFIQLFATILLWVEVIALAIGGFFICALIAEELDVSTFAMIIFTYPAIVAIGWVFFYFEYSLIHGFGELIENSHTLAEHAAVSLDEHYAAKYAQKYNAPKTTPAKPVQPAQSVQYVQPVPPVKPVTTTQTVKPATTTVGTTTVAKPQTVTTTTVKPQAATANQKEQEQLYLFAMQMMERRSYDIAYNTFSKIKGYKNTDAFLKKLEDMKKQ